MRISLNKILKISVIFSSFNAKPLMTVIEACEPAFPPVSISIGIKEINAGVTVNASSNSVIMNPVMIADNIKTNNQTTRFFAMIVGFSCK